MGFCCTYDLPVHIPPIPYTVPPLILAPLVAGLAVLQAQMMAYLDQIQLPKCPLD